MAQKNWERRIEPQLILARASCALRFSRAAAARLSIPAAVLAAVPLSVSVGLVRSAQGEVAALAALAALAAPLVLAALVAQLSCAQQSFCAARPMRLMN